MMRKPNLAELAHVAEITAAIAVIISLIYVGQQVRENTAAIRSATMQAVANSSDVALQNQAASEQISRIRRIGDTDISALTPAEAARYWTIYRAIWIRMQNIHAQQQLGVLDDSFWYTYSKIICEIYDIPGARAIWPSHADVLDPEFVEFVESCTEK
ncbi:MAG: hypothetical protein KJN95_00020 [Gammaproteobacteria bacterium]|nr:hypothetical protein [Gammaproteobacteria bacterium]